MVERLASSLSCHVESSIRDYSIRANFTMGFRRSWIPSDVELSQQLHCLPPEQTPS